MNTVPAPGVPSIVCLQVVVQTPSVMASKCISKLGRLRPPSSYLQTHSRHRLRPSSQPNSHDTGLQVRMITATKCISKLAQLRPPSSHHLGLEGHILNLTRSRLPTISPNSLGFSLQVRSIMASMCIYTLAWSRPPSASPNSVDHCLEMYLWVHPVCIFMRTLNCSQAQPAASPDIPCIDW